MCTEGPLPLCSSSCPGAAKAHLLVNLFLMSLLAAFAIRSAHHIACICSLQSFAGHLPDRASSSFILSSCKIAVVRAPCSAQAHGRAVRRSAVRIHGSWEL